ncbi:MAG: phosphopantothenoylcysteine decarboxylase, partial [Verrucomicrobia bacterium]|nr:phosphopantothenoylcysteine decarboxylase [Verrucomicrobiota bacterium]
MTSKNNSKTIVIGITGSIAAYKAADIVSQLRQRGYEIFVVMTHGAKNFITPLT